jgi:hypothetical protein
MAQEVTTEKLLKRAERLHEEAASVVAESKQIRRKTRLLLSRVQQRQPRTDA